MKNHTIVNEKQARLGWIDVAKGISILLVVLIHARRWLEFIGAKAVWIEQFNAIFLTARMPLFFTMSGLLAIKWIQQKTWKELYTHKLSLILWVFIVWQPIVFTYKYAAAIILPNQEDPSLNAHLLRMFAFPLRPNGELWFLWALILAFTTAKLTHWVPSRVQVAVSGLISAGWITWAKTMLGASLFRLIGSGWDGLFTYYFFFISAVLYKDQIISLVSKLSAFRAAFIISSWLIVYGIIVNLQITSLPGIGLLLKLLGVASGLALAVLLSRVTLLASLGQQTLPIYLAHSFFIVITVCLLHLSGIQLSPILAASIAPWVLTGLAVMLSLAFSKKAGNGFFQFLFIQPEWFKSIFSDKRNAGINQRMEIVKQEKE